MDEREKNLRSKLGDEWYEKMKNEFNQDYLQKVSMKVAQERAKKKIFPNTEDLFNAFKLTPYSRTKVVIIGQD